MEIARQFKSSCVALETTAPMHYQIQFSHLINDVLWYSTGNNFTASGQAIISINTPEKYTSNIITTSSSSLWVNRKGKAPMVENIKTTSMEDVSTRVLEKIKNI